MKDQNTFKMSTESVDNILRKSSSSSSPDPYFLYCFKYEYCIFVLAVIGSITQIRVMSVIINYLVVGFGFDREQTEDMEERWLMRYAHAYSAVAILCLFGSACSEVYLIRAVNKRFHVFIQHWMMSTLLIFVVSIIMGVVTGFTLVKDYEKTFWILGAYLLLVIRLPVQMYFVDKFAHAKLFNQELND